MNINLTLLGQTITFIVFVWFCMKFVWPPIMNALEQRKKKIADGLAAAERGAHEKELAEKRATETLHEAKQKAQEIINQAQKRANEIVEEAKDNARSEAERIVAAANAEIEQEVNRAREQLRGQVVSLAVAGAGKVLKKEIDAKANEELLQDLVAQL
jgi:F-type H+-transporting ATPase subunit b